MSRSNEPANVGNLSVKVLNGRLGNGNALMFFNVAIGADGKFGLVVRDLVLRTSQRDGSYYPSFPSKQRMRKAVGTVDGRSQDVYVPVLDKNKNNQPIYDQLVDLYYEGEGDQRKVVDFGWEVRRAIIEQAVPLYERLRGGARAPAAAPPAGVSTSTGAPRSRAPLPVEFPGGAEDDDDLPF